MVNDSTAVCLWKCGGEDMTPSRNDSTDFDYNGGTLERSKSSSDNFILVVPHFTLSSNYLYLQNKLSGNNFIFIDGSPTLPGVQPPPPFLTEGAALQKDNGDFDQIFKIGKLSFQVNYRTKYKVDGD